MFPKHHPLHLAVFSADILIRGCNTTWHGRHEDLANPLLRTWVILLKILCIHTRLKTVGTARVKGINLAESDLVLLTRMERLSFRLMILIQLFYQNLKCFLGFIVFRTLMYTKLCQDYHPLINRLWKIKQFSDKISFGQSFFKSYCG